MGGVAVWVREWWWTGKSEIGGKKRLPETGGVEVERNQSEGAEIHRLRLEIYHLRLEIHRRTVQSCTQRLLVPESVFVGLAVGAVAGVLGGLALEEGIKYEEEKIAERVENDMASRDDHYSEFHADF
ncbi:unnamed protein product [Fraxinus pennsylvanica]|uniref:Uncharacterized protein n=1 Tax=Fraxinus pennsylvanica TaxID=56036 RepID=A0AAD1ZDY5_9LAMI|nr:unnamed protein product [Fraxinus pennsylvanica]